MSDFIVTILTLLLLALITLIATIIIVAGFIGVGALFARFTELTLFQATIVAAPVGGATLYLVGRLLSLPTFPQSQGYYEEEEDWDEGDEWDEDVDFEDLPPQTRRRILRYVSELLEDTEAHGEESPPPPPRKRRRR